MDGRWALLRGSGYGLVTWRVGRWGWLLLVGLERRGGCNRVERGWVGGLFGWPRMGDGGGRYGWGHVLTMMLALLDWAAADELKVCFQYH